MTDYRLDDRGSIPGRGRNFSLLHELVQTYSGAHPPIQWVTAGKVLEHEADRTSTFIIRGISFMTQLLCFVGTKAASFMK
jgi:hypothetical protein